MRLTSLSGRTPAFGSPLSRPAVLITSRFVCDSCSFHHDSSAKLILAYQRHLHRGDPSATTKLSPRKVTAAKGAMLMFKRQVVEQTTFLFYDHFKSYFEETNFCRRAANCGWETRFVPTPPIDHLCGATSTRFDRDEIWIQYFRNIIFSFARNWGRWGRFVMLPLFCCAAFDKSPRNLVKASREKRG